MVAVALAGGGLWWRHERAWLDSPQRIALEWSCSQIRWTDERTGIDWGLDYRGGVPDDHLVTPGALDTKSMPSDPDPAAGAHHADGMVTFESEDRAVFTSDAGGSAPARSPAPARTGHEDRLPCVAPGTAANRAPFWPRSSPSHEQDHGQIVRGAPDERRAGAVS